MAIMHKAIIFLLPEFETNKSQCSKLQVDNCLSLFLRQLCCLSYASVQRDFHITWCSCRRRVTRQVLLVDQVMDILPDHLCSTKVFFVMFVFLDIYFSVFWSFLPLFVLVFLLVAIVLSILYRFTASDLTTPLVSSTLSYILHLTGICLIMFSFVYWLCVVLDLLLTKALSSSFITSISSLISLRKISFVNEIDLVLLLSIKD